MYSKRDRNIASKISSKTPSIRKKWSPSKTLTKTATKTPRRKATKKAFSPSLRRAKISDAKKKTSAKKLEIAPKRDKKKAKKAIIFWSPSGSSRKIVPQKTPIESAKTPATIQKFRRILFFGSPEFTAFCLLNIQQMTPDLCFW